MVREAAQPVHEVAGSAKGMAGFVTGASDSESCHNMMP